MIIASNTAAQTLTTGQSLVFDSLRQTGCSELVRQNTTNVYLKSGGLYLVDFSGNVTTDAATTPVQLSLELNGSPVPEGTAQTTIVAAGDIMNISRSTAISTSGNCGFNLQSAYLTLTNNGPNPISVNAGFSIRVGRVG